VSTRRAVFAGSWYPGNPKECEKEIRSFLKEPLPQIDSERNFNGGIVPHAGWYFSGSIACNVIHRLIDEKPPDVFVISGMHLYEGASSFIMAEGSWETPFGPVDVEENLARELTQRFSFQLETPGNYSQDNTIELQLPFIKHFFASSKIVPIGIPPAKNAIQIGTAAVEIAKKLGLRVKFIGSTDLTHYGHNYGFAPKGEGPDAVDWVRNENDRRVIDLMLGLNPEGVIAEALSSRNACCAGAAATAIAGAKALGTDHAELLAYATSYDKSPGNNLVGYVGILL
jgi:MEMO1 family protein